MITSSWRSAVAAALTVFLMGSAAWGETSPERPRVWRTRRSPLCTGALFVLGSLALTGVTAYLSLNPGSAAEATGVHEGAPKPAPAVNPLKDSPFFGDNTVATFQVLNEQGNEPEISLFGLVTMRFAGLVMETSYDSPDEVSLRLVGRTQQIALKEKISRKRLESGEELTLNFPSSTVKAAGQTVTGSAKLVLRYDAATRALMVLEASGQAQASTFLGTRNDSGSITNARAVPAKLDLKDRPLKAYEETP